MKKFSQIVSRLIDSYRQEQYEPVLEMATISKKLKVGNTTYKVAVHGPASKDPYKEFNFEISLVDLLCYDELNLVTMIDKEKHLNITNRNKCSWKGYRGLHDEFEDWLERPSEFPGISTTTWKLLFGIMIMKTMKTMHY